MTIYEEAKQLLPELIKHRRYLHENAEFGFDLPMTTSYVKEVLESYDLKPYEPCKGAIAVDIAPGKETFLLRADLDALPIEEKNHLTFKSKTPYSHNCGHDLHTTMLLGAAKLLKTHEKELESGVRLIFQPDEEGVRGADELINSGFITPDIKAALALHVSPVMTSGNLFYRQGAMYASSDVFRIEIEGNGGHGAAPHETIDPINVAIQIYQTIQALISRECPPREMIALSICTINAGKTFNVIPNTAVMTGTMRTYNETLRHDFCNRLKQIIPLIGLMWKAKADNTFTTTAPSVYCDEKLTNQLLDIYKTHLPKDRVQEQAEPFSWSEDFGAFGKLIPIAMLTVGTQVSGSLAPIHDPAVLFDENAMPIGSASLALAAMHYKHTL